MLSASHSLMSISHAAPANPAVHAVEVVVLVLVDVLVIDVTLVVVDDTDVVVVDVWVNVVDVVAKNAGATFSLLTAHSGSVLESNVRGFFAKVQPAPVGTGQVPS